MAPAALPAPPTDQGLPGDNTDWKGVSIGLMVTILLIATIMYCFLCYSRQKAKREKAALELRLQKMGVQVAEMDYTIKLMKQTWQPPVVPGLSSPETPRPLPAAHRIRRSSNRPPRPSHWVTIRAPPARRRWKMLDMEEQTTESHELREMTPAETAVEPPGREFDCWDVDISPPSTPGASGGLKGDSRAVSPPDSPRHGYGHGRGR